MSDWTDERVKQLTTMWGEGWPAYRIACALGGVTRNAVIGKANRMGLNGGASHVLKRRQPAPLIKRIAPLIKCIAPAISTSPLPPEPKVPAKRFNGEYATVLTIRDGLCRWPIGDPAKKDFHFCGQDTKAVYCAAHHAIAYQGVMAKRAVGS
jgi:GcrA cell cycle regulator